VATGIRLGFRTAIRTQQASSGFMAMNQTCKPEMTLRFFFSIERKKIGGQR
jgi:hypothetical protein